MDVQPTTSADVIQAENQGAIDALRRLVATREALNRTFEGQPSLEEPTTAAAQRLLGALPAFWASPGGNGERRDLALGRHVASVMKEEAILRGFDGTLTREAVGLASRVAATDGTPLPSGLHVRELMLGGFAHAGSLIVVDEAMPHVALLFTAHGGWEAFDSMDRLLASTRRRLLESVSAADGAGLEGDEFAEAKALDTVGARDIAGPVFATLANRMIEVQLGRVTLAADDHALDGDRPDAAGTLGDRVRHELLPAAMLDIDAIEQLREARLVEAAVAARLADVPEPVRAAWYEARDRYNDILAAAGMLRPATGAQPPLTLNAFATRELAAKLASLGVNDSPESIMVDIARVRVLPDALAFLDPLPGSTTPRRVSLVDFACQNVGRFSLDTLHAFDADGTSLQAQLGHATLRDMVRDLDLARRYQAHVEERLRRGSVGALARKLAMAVQAAQMRMEVAEARLSYYLADEPRSFIDDRDERGFRWVEAALHAPSGQRQVDRHDIVVSQLTYQQVPLDGVLLFGARAPGSVPRIVVYTPGAPDGLTFREFATRADAAKHLFYHPAFREYLLDRLPAEFATVSPNGATRRFAGDHLAHWVLGASGDAPYTQTTEPFGEREITGDFLAAAHDATVEKIRRDARFLARSTADADSDAWFGYLQDRLNPAGANLTTAALIDVPASLARMMQASWRFYDHVKAGDTGQAIIAFTDGYVNALNIVVPPYVGGRVVAGSIVRSRLATRGVARTAIRLAPPVVHFDDRYAVRHLRKRGKPDQEGIFRLGGQTYIEQEGTMYLVRRDTDLAHWRLMPPRGALDARFTGPLVERIDGRWIYARDVGLRGGVRGLRRRLSRLLLGDGAAAPVVPLPNAAPPAAPFELAMPPVMEPFRAEITAVLADNPSASALIKDDGSYMKVVVQPRSALILEPHLHPDLAELSAHQRRTFLHELETRFPLGAERAEVLSRRGWSAHDGRRVPSPTPSTGSSMDIDVQSPSISSSTGEPISPVPSLTSSQHARWDDALTVARRTPRSPRHTSAATVGDAVSKALSATELVPREEWPDRVWYFSERAFVTESWPVSGREGVTLDGNAAWFGNADGVHSYPVSVLPPETPVHRLDEALGTSRVQQVGQRDPLAYALQIDLRRFREPWQQVGRNHIVIGDSTHVELRRRVLPDGEYQYLLQARQPVRIPSTFIVNAGRRGARPNPLPPARY